jgi:hypothetical protein
MFGSLYNRVIEIQKELDYCDCSDQRQRHLESELERLLAYQEAHPDQEDLPNSLQLYCFENPNAVECKVFDV